MPHEIYGCELKSVIVNTSICDFKVYQDGTLERVYASKFTQSKLYHFDADFLEKVKQVGLDCLNNDKFKHD